MKLTRIRTDTAARHVSSRSASHIRDKAQGDARREYKFVAVETETRPSRERTFPGVGGIEAIRDLETGHWRGCKGPDDLGNYLVRESAARTRYQAMTNRHGHPEMMTRRDPNPIAVHTTSWHPAVSDMIADKLARGEGREMPKEIFIKWAARVPILFAEQRVVLACALHLDTGDGHIDTAVARNTPTGRIGKAGLGLVGSWAVAVDRQLRCGAKINQQKRAQFARAMANFHRREGADTIPFDVQLARLMDTICDEVCGPGVNPYVARYAEEIPQMERAHALAALRELDAARAKLVELLGSDAPGQPLAQVAAPQVLHSQFPANL